MNWQFFITLNILTYSLTVILQRVFIKESSSHPLVYSIFFQLFTGIFVTIIGFCLGAMSFPNIKPILLNLLLGTFLYAFANVFIFKALQATEASRFTVIFSSRVFFTILASTLLLGEFFTLKQLAGTLLIFGAVILVSMKSRKFIFTKGDTCSLLAAILFGLANTNAKYLLHSFTVYPYMTFVFFAPSLLLASLYPKEIANSKYFFCKSTILKMALLAVANGLANIGFFEALRRGPSSSAITTVQLTSVIVIVLLSVILLKERDRILNKVLGAAISIIGLILII